MKKLLALLVVSAFVSSAFADEAVAPAPAQSSDTVSATKDTSSHSKHAKKHGGSKHHHKQKASAE